jgi:signal transduction histidine kinase
MEEQPAYESSDSNDFAYEAESTMEIPVSDSGMGMPSMDAPSMDIPSMSEGIPSNLQQELKTVLSYMDQLLESLPEEKIEEFAKSEYFETYKKLFEELGLA